MTQITTSKEFVVPLENKPGTLGDIANALGKANVNITGFLVESQGEFGVFRFTTNEPTKTESWLKQSSRPYRANEVLVAAIANTPGELGRIASTLAKSGVNIQATYPSSTLTGSNVGVTIAVSDLPTARKILGQ